MQEENISNYIIDSSFILGYLLPDENVVHVDEVFKKYTQGTVSFFSSPLLPFEVVNGIKYAIVSKRIDNKKAHILIRDFSNVVITLEDVDFEEILEKSLSKNLSVYDAPYLWLSHKKNFPLLTLDKRIQRLLKK